MLIVLDEYSREGHTITVGLRLDSSDVEQVLGIFLRGMARRRTCAATTAGSSLRRRLGGG